MTTTEKSENGNGHLTMPNGNHNEFEVDEGEAMENQLEEYGIVKAPDGGFGWFVVFASFMANLIVDGVIFSISETIVPLWEKEFNTSTSMATVAPSLLAGCYMLTGPLASALANSFGCDKVAMAGALIAAAGFVISVLVPALPVLYFTFGIIGGVGYGMIFLPAVVIVGQYFSEKRALATGIATCGSGIGTTLLSYINPIVLTLVNNQWRVFLVYIAVITLFGIVFGYFFKPLKPSDTQVEQATKIAAQYLGNQADDIPVDEPPQELTSSPYVAQGVAIERFRSATHRSTLRSASVSRPFLSTVELHASRQGDRQLLSNRDLASAVTRASIADLNRPMSRMDVFYAGSTSNVAQRSAKDLTNENGQPQSQQKSNLYLSTAGLPSADDGSEETSSWKRSILAPLRTMLDFSLLKSPSFIILAASSFLTLSCLFVPFMFIGALAKQSGIEESWTKYLVMILGFVNLGARVLCGFISDHPKVDPLAVSNWAVILGGLATIAAPLLTTFWQYALYCLPFAFGVGCFASMRSIICVELLGLERLTNAFGILLLFMGIAALIGPPFAALLKNLTNSFNLSFYVMGTLMTLSGIISLPLRSVNTWEKKKMGIDASPVELQPLKA